MKWYSWNLQYINWRIFVVNFKSNMTEENADDPACEIILHLGCSDCFGLACSELTHPSAWYQSDDPHGPRTAYNHGECQMYFLPGITAVNHWTNFRARCRDRCWKWFQTVFKPGKHPVNLGGAYHESCVCGMRKKLSRLDNVILCWLFLLYTFYWLMWLIWTHWKTQFGQTLVPPEVCTIAVLFGEMGLGKVSVPIMSLGFLPQLSYVSWMFPKWPRWKKNCCEICGFDNFICSVSLWYLTSFLTFIP